MTIEERINAFVAMHHSSCINDSLVFEVWEDGEITLTKGGTLYGYRNLHCIVPGDEKRALNPILFPEELRIYGHARIMVENGLKALEARDLLFGKKPKEKINIDFDPDLH